jgi:integrase
MEDISQLIEKANQKLNQVRITRHGNRLYLRGTFPKRPGEGSGKKRYELATGLAAIARDLRFALGIAHDVEGQLLREQFDWTPFLKAEHKLQLPETVGEWIERVTYDHWKKTERNFNKQNTWQKNYAAYYNRLPADQPLTAELLEKTILKYSNPATRARGFYCLAYRRLAKLAGIEDEIPFKELSKGYKSKSGVSAALLPTDEQIVEAILAIKNPAWKWLAAMMATFGIRNHEVFYLDCSQILDSKPRIRVLQGKTGGRLVWPCPTDWIERFELWDIKSTAIQYDVLSNNTAGTKVTQYFKKLKLPFTPYRLRDAYAVRLAVYGVDIAIASKWMGHSVTTHFEKYLDAINEIQHSTAFDLMQLNEARIKEIRALDQRLAISKD